MQIDKIYMTADWHLGKCPYGDRVLEEDFYEAANSVIDLAIQNNIKVILNAGDIFDANKPKMAAVDVLSKLHHKLIDHQITMYTMMGNHDFTVDGSWCSLFEGSDSNKSPYGVKDISDKAVMLNPNTKVVALIGKTKSELIEKLSDPVFQDADIFMLHCPCKEIVDDFGREDIFSVEECFIKNKLNTLKRNQCFLIGDTHVTLAKNVHADNTNSDIAVISPGSTEMTSASEPINKFIIEACIDLTSGSVDRVQSIELPSTKRRITNSKAIIATSKDLDKFIKQELLDPQFDLAKERVMIYLYYYPDKLNDVESRIMNIIHVNPKSRLRLIPKVDPSKLQKLNLTLGDDTYNDLDDSNLVGLKSLSEFANSTASKIKLSDVGKSIFFDLLKRDADIDNDNAISILKHRLEEFCEQKLKVQKDDI